jgi:translation initiation factor IF-3
LKNIVFDRNQPPKSAQTPSTRINEQIKISPLRVVDADGTMLGVIPRDRALEIARERELDLVEVAPTERPPVCKIMDFGKFKFEQNKKTRKQTKSHSQLKEVRFRPGCGAGDLEVKIRHAREFLEERHKVLFVVQMRGRENIYSEDALRLAESVLEKVADIGKIEKRPMREGKRITAVVAPK